MAQPLLTPDNSTQPTFVSLTLYYVITCSAVMCWLTFVLFAKTAFNDSVSLAFNTSSYSKVTAHSPFVNWYMGHLPVTVENTLWMVRSSFNDVYETADVDGRRKWNILDDINVTVADNLRLSPTYRPVVTCRPISVNYGPMILFYRLVYQNKHNLIDKHGKYGEISPLFTRQLKTSISCAGHRHRKILTW